jgi:quercetin dioxygenase-like cupin family protein
MNALVEHWDVQRDGALSETAMRCKLEAKGFKVTRYVYPPATHFPEHSHAVDKIDAVLSGRFKLSMQGESVMLMAGDMLAIPRGVLHSAEVLGDEPVVSLDAVKQA